MMKDAEAHADEDRKRREDAEVRNTSESLQYQTEKFLAENADKIPEASKTELGEALTELRSALGGSDIDAIKAAQEKVASTSQQIGAAMYQQPGAETPGAEAPGADATAGAAGASAGPTGAAADEDVVDAEIVDDEPGEGQSK